MKKKFVKFSATFLLVFLFIGCNNSLTDIGDPEGNNVLSRSAASTAATAKPFPQELNYPGTTKPEGLSQSQLNSDVTDLYDAWKDEYLGMTNFWGGAYDKCDGTDLTGARSFNAYYIKAEANGDIDGWADHVEVISQSEAHGYGMITFVLMAGYDPEARGIFDNMYRLYRNLPSNTNSDLMSWALPGHFLNSPLQASATDGDMDVAYALLLAHEQWGGSPYVGPNIPSISYYDAALKIINALKENNLYTDEGTHFPRLGIGDNTGNYYKYRATRSSDFMLSHLDLYQRATKDDIWTDVRDNILSIVSHVQSTYSPETGLMPDFMGNKGSFNVNIQTFDGVSDEAGGKYDDSYFYNGCRFPWRFALSYAHEQHSGAKTALGKINTWLKREYGTGNSFNAAGIKAGYHLNGEVNNHEDNPEWDAPWDDNSFTAPFMAGLMVGDHAKEMRKIWDAVKGFQPPDQYGTNYYPNTLKLLSMLLVSGNWWAPEGSRTSGPDTTPLWSAGISYSTGDIVSYNNTDWVNTFAHTSASHWYPGAPGLWFWEKL